MTSGARATQQSPPSAYLRLGSMALIGSLLLMGCGGPTTPVGPLGTPLQFSEGLDQHNDSPSVPVVDPSQRHQATFNLGDPAAKLRLTWTNLEKDNHLFLASAAVEVVEAAPGVSLQLDSASNPINIGTTQAAIEQRSFLLTWSRQTFLKTQRRTVQVRFAANGKWSME